MLDVKKTFSYFEAKQNYQWCVNYRSTVTVERFEKFSLNFSFSLFAIRVNLLHP